MPSSESKRRTRSVAFAGVVAAVALVGLAPDARAQTAPPPPSSATAASTWMSVGATTFAAAYMASALTATTDYYTDAATSSKRTDLWVPVFGPIDQIGKTSSAGLDALLVLDALAELGGLTMFGFGVAESMSHPSPLRAAAPGAATHPVLYLSSLPVAGATGAALAATF
jgi:hypothetical protein